MCPGSNTDRFVWNFSETKDYYESLRNNPAIVATEGYYYLLGKNFYIKKTEKNLHSRCYYIV